MGLGAPPLQMEALHIITRRRRRRRRRRSIIIPHATNDAEQCNGSSSRDAMLARPAQSISTTRDSQIEERGSEGGGRTETETEKRPYGDGRGRSDGRTGAGGSRMDSAVGTLEIPELFESGGRALACRAAPAANRSCPSHRRGASRQEREWLPPPTTATWPSPS